MSTFINVNWLLSNTTTEQRREMVARIEALTPPERGDWEWIAKQIRVRLALESDEHNTAHVAGAVRPNPFTDAGRMDAVLRPSDHDR